MSYAYRKSDPASGQAHICGGANQLMESRPSSLYHWISNGNKDIFHTKRPHAITNSNVNTNMDMTNECS